MTVYSEEETKWLIAEMGNPRAFDTMVLFISSTRIVDLYRTDFEKQCSEMHELRGSMDGLLDCYGRLLGKVEQERKSKRNLALALFSTWASLCIGAMAYLFQHL